MTIKTKAGFPAAVPAYVAVCGTRRGLAFTAADPICRRAFLLSQLAIAICALFFCKAAKKEKNGKEKEESLRILYGSGEKRENGRKRGTDGDGRNRRNRRRDCRSCGVADAAGGTAARSLRRAQRGFTRTGASAGTVPDEDGVSARPGPYHSLSGVPANKTQVFLAPAGDHYRTRLTHTLEVSQIARTMARALRLNEDLTEAAALGHDLGHTPFGHAGEAALRACYDSRFAHYEQSLRVVDRLENDGRGLNLTFEVRDAIVNHTGEHMAATLEGVLIKFADRIAYINHDIDDACRAGLLDPGDIPADICRVLGDSHSSRINTMVSSVVRASMDRDSISMEPEVQEATVQLREFLFEQVYLNPRAKGQESKAQELVKTLFGYYATHPDRMPELYRRLAAEGEPVERCVCDFISGMTDRYAIETYEELFVPRVWRGLHE